MTTVFQRPQWDHYFLGLTVFIAARSHDTQTQHGCIITSPDHRVLSMGYNGFPRGLRDDSRLPSTRPDKYPWMLHAEANAIANVRGTDLTGGTAYVDGTVCFRCMVFLWQAGIARIVQTGGYGWVHDQAEAPLKEEFLSQVPLQLVTLQPDYEWIAMAAVNHPAIRYAVEAKLHDEALGKAAYGQD